MEKFGKIDILVLGAGIAAHSFFRDFEDLGAFKQLMEVNFMGYLYLCRYALDTLRKNKGQIVALGSLSGQIGLPYRSAYCASKHAVTDFFRSLRIEEPEICVSLGLPDTFTGSNFRNNSLVKEKNLGDGDRRHITVDQVADACMEAADRKVEDFYPANKSWFIMLVYSNAMLFRPSFANKLVRKAAKL